MRREGAAHAHRDSRRAVHQELRKPRGKDDRFLERVVVVRPEPDRVLVDLEKEFFGDHRQPRFGVPHGSGRVAVHAPEIAGTIDQGIAERKGLRHPDHGVVRGLVAVGMELAEHLADHGSALSELCCRAEAHLPHGEEDPAVHGLEPVPHVREGPGDDGG